MRVGNVVQALAGKEIGQIFVIVRLDDKYAYLSNGHEIITYLSGKLRKNYIKVLEGDKVKVEMSPYDLTKGRITWREKGC